MQVYVVGKTNTITNSLKSQKGTMGNGERMKQIYILIILDVILQLY